MPSRERAPSAHANRQTMLLVLNMEGLISVDEASGDLCPFGKHA